MDEITTMIIEFIVKYGWQLGVCAVAGIFLLGCIKMTGLFDKISNTQLRKFSYIAVSFILSMGACVTYQLITHTFNWAGFGVLSGSILLLNQSVYQLYETLGIRAVWKKLLGLIKTGLKSIKSPATKQAESLITALEKVIVLTDAQKSKIISELLNGDNK